MNFIAKRPDGRSLRVIAIDTIGPMEPDTVVTYKQLGSNLGLNPHTQRNLIQGAVNQALEDLAKLHQRAVEVVPNKGYRVLRADEHRRFAVSKQSRAERQMKKALRALMHARLDEMSEEGRTLHQQQTMITSATLAAFQYHEERLNRIEALLRGTTTLNPDDPDRSK